MPRTTTSDPCDTSAKFEGISSFLSGLLMQAQCADRGSYRVQEQDVRQIFDPFGPIDYVTMQKELAGGRQSSVAFVQ